MCKVSGVKYRLKLFLVKRLSSISHSDSYRLIFNKVSGKFGERLFWTLVTILLFRIFCSEPGRGSLPGLFLKWGKAGGATSAPWTPPAPGHLVFWFCITNLCQHGGPILHQEPGLSPCRPQNEKLIFLRDIVGLANSHRACFFFVSLALIQLKVEVATGFCTTLSVQKHGNKLADAINNTCRGKCWFEKQ